MNAPAPNKPPAGHITPLPNITATCWVCGQQFETESAQFRSGAILSANVCDCCDTHTVYDAQEDAARLTVEERRKRRWLGMTAPRYAEFRRERLPVEVQPHVERVLAWKPQPEGVGIGFSGPPRTGKSPLIFALGQALFISGVDVFPTSGIEFQREYQRGIEERDGWRTYLRDCEECDVLLLDDADKLNLSPGVEAEYYGMLETRRNWMRPVICTVNLTAGEIMALGRHRSDRVAAIVERLSDLCEFIPV